MVVQRSCALVWKRSDFSESSRLVTLLTREYGKIRALAKGAHRGKSPFLGRLDHLNLVLPSFAAARSDDGLRLLRGAMLLHEPRALREPARYLAAAHLCELFDTALPDGRADPELFDLLNGALVVLERCPPRALQTAVAGVELRYLKNLGLLPGLAGCSVCGTETTALHLAAGGRGLLCSRHRSRDPELPTTAIDWLRGLAATPARDWLSLPPPPRSALGALGLWVATALERKPRLRARVMAATPGSAAIASARS